MFANVEFESQGALLRGRLYRPPVTEPAPVVIMAHGTSATITMTADRYAEVFRESGFAVLLYDHRNFGASGGEPRQEINPWVQVRGYCDAMTYMESVPGIDPDAMAIWGDSYSAAEVIVVGAVDTRPAAVVAQIPAIGARLAPPDPDGALFAALRHTVLDGSVDGGPQDTTDPLPVVSADQIHTPSLLTPIQAFRWFIEYGGRHGTGWENRATRVVPPTPCPFHAGIAAPYLLHPLLMLVAPEDEMPAADPEVSRAAYNSVPGPKELLEIDGGHFGLLHHPGVLFDQASTAQSEFLLRTLH
ncbi:MAG TPA: CocE/NonD family hydrolase [Acidimicrobiales bacterium]|nr:CocE/NonD family hydrolase [Acidimicrobiales bacterium]